MRELLRDSRSSEPLLSELIDTVASLFFFLRLLPWLLLSVSVSLRFFFLLRLQTRPLLSLLASEFSSCLPRQLAFFRLSRSVFFCRLSLLHRSLNRNSHIVCPSRRESKIERGKV